MNLVKRLSSAALMLLLPAAGAYADEVCTTKQVSVPVYSGWSSCTTYSNGQWVELEEYVGLSYSSTTRIYSGALSCNAQVPYAGTQLVNVEECTTVISADISVSQNYKNNIGHNIVTVSSNSDANEGETLTGYKWWVNGAYKGSSSSFSMDNFDGGYYANIELQVTDSSGATASTTSRVYIYPYTSSGSGNCGGKGTGNYAIKKVGEEDKEAVIVPAKDVVMPACY
ncbi:hypothetical protein [Thalassomonas actiniarum]|uniref:Ig-like domain-containing protein n=1 Tax=Thalassomonas actiniarum TaxID=485447 RepID=A0AAE9YJD7_9GAMM|nr:hypothetical protein [Thalassomonas actiniarum]WDD96792.1 hypothetical protein SG35_015565 [Thalassomonas actiniarum]